MLDAFAERSAELELIDTGDYTSEEYEQFLIDIRVVNRLAGDTRALTKTLLHEIDREDLDEFSILDVGAGSGELLRKCAKFSRRTRRSAKLYGLELNARSASAIAEESTGFSEIFSVRADVFDLPFEDNSIDYVMCSLFTHHFSDSEIVKVLDSMARVAARKIFIIDLHRHPMAYALYKAFCAVFIKGVLVKTDGALSILRGFKPSELEAIAKKARIFRPEVRRHFPYRLVLEAECLK